MPQPPWTGLPDTRSTGYVDRPGRPAWNAIVCRRSGTDGMGIPLYGLYHVAYAAVAMVPELLISRHSHLRARLTWGTITGKGPARI